MPYYDPYTGKWIYDDDTPDWLPVGAEQTGLPTPAQRPTVPGLDIPASRYEMPKPIQPPPPIISTSPKRRPTSSPAIPGMEQLGELPDVPILSPNVRPVTAADYGAGLRPEGIQAYARRVGEPNPDLADLENLAIAGPLSGLGELATAATNPGARLLARSIAAPLGAYFSYQMGKGGLEHGKEAVEAYQRDDIPGALRLLGTAGLEGFMSWMGLKAGAGDLAKLEPQARYAARQAEMPPSTRDIGAGGTRGPVEPEVMPPEPQTAPRAPTWQDFMRKSREDAAEKMYEDAVAKGDQATASAVVQSAKEPTPELPSPVPIPGQELHPVLASAGERGSLPIEPPPPPSTPSPSPLPVTRPEPTIEELIAGESSGFYPKELQQHAKEAESRFERDWINRYNPIKELINERMGGTPLPVESDPFIGAMLYAGHYGKIDNRLNDLAKVLPKASFKESLPIVGSKPQILKDAIDYAILDRQDEAGTRTEDPISTFEGGATLEEVQAKRDALKAQLLAQPSTDPAYPNRFAEVEHYLTGIRDFTKRMVLESRDAGLLSEAGAEKMLANNQRYIPLQRLAKLSEKLEDPDSLPRGSTAFSIPTQDIFWKLKGSELAIADPIESIIRNVHRTVSLIERNKVARQAAALSTRPEFKDVIYPVSSSKVLPEGTKRFSLMLDGKKVDYAAPAGFTEALKNMHKQEIDLLTGWMAKSSSLLRTGATGLNVAFIPANFWRDMHTAITTTKQLGINPIAWPYYFARGFALAIGEGKTYRDYLESGGSFSGYYERLGDVPKTARALIAHPAYKTLQNLNPVTLAPIRWVGSKIEEATRMGVFEQTRKRQQEPGLRGAGYTGRQSTVDFSETGNYMRVLNLWVPFLRARALGLRNIIRAFKENPVRATFVSMFTVGIPMLATYAWNMLKYPEEFKKLSKQTRRQNFVLIHGHGIDDKGRLIYSKMLPKGDLAQAIANPIENFLDWMYENNPKKLARVLTEVFSDISPAPFEDQGKINFIKLAGSLLPPTPKGILEGGTNLNFNTMRPIVPQRLQEGSPEEQYRWDTPSSLQVLAKPLGISPLTMGNFVGTQFGGLGRQLVDPMRAKQTMFQRYTGGAYTNLTDELIDEDLKPIQQRYANIKIRQWREVNALYNQMKADPEKGLPAFFNWLDRPDIKGNPDQGIPENTYAMNLMKDLIKQKTGEAKALTSEPNVVKATYLAGQLIELPPEKWFDKFEEWHKQGILTDSLAGILHQTMKLHLPQPAQNQQSQNAR